LDVIEGNILGPAADTGTSMYRQQTMDWPQSMIFDIQWLWDIVYPVPGIEKRDRGHVPGLPSGIFHDILRVARLQPIPAGFLGVVARHEHKVDAEGLMMCIRAWE